MEIVCIAENLDFCSEWTKDSKKICDVYNVTQEQVCDDQIFTHHTVILPAAASSTTGCSP
jgi:hypothetical protein